MNESRQFAQETQPSKMAVLKRDRKFNVFFIKPIRGLYEDQSITVTEFRERNAGILKNRWLDTSHGTNGDKIYSMFDSSIAPDIVKENLQEWLCDNRLEVTECISIALRNHERTYSEWFRYVDGCSSPDELAYCLSRKHGIHKCVLNKSYIWTTLSNHITRSDDEIIELCGVNLVYLGPARYGVLRKIRRPAAQSIPKNATPVKVLTITPTNRSRKTTCRDDKKVGGKKRGHSGQGSGNKVTGRTAPKVKRTQTLCESRSQLFGITPPVTRSLRTRLNPIDYVLLNDGFEDETAATPRKKKRESHRPRSALSATRVAAQKNSSEAKESTDKTDTSKSTTLTGVPKPCISVPDGSPTLTGVQHVTKPDDDKVTALPDASSQSNTLPVTATNLPGIPDSSNLNADTLLDLVNIRTTDAENTEGVRVAIDALLSLGGSSENQMDEEDNAALMPIGTPTDIVDAAPVPILLDQVNVDNAIANIINTEQNEADVPKSTEADDDPLVAQGTTKPLDTDPSTAMTTDTTSAINTHGLLKIRTHALKKKPDGNRRYKCTVCGEMCPTMQQVNAHHLEKHKPQTCTVCG